MANRTTTVQDDNDAVDSSEDMDITISTILEELEQADDVQCAVYKESGRDARQCAFMFAFDASDYTFTDLREKVALEYGGGDYRLRVTSGNRLKYNRPFSILAKPGALPASGVAPGAGIELLISAMVDGQNKILSAITNQKTPEERQRETLEMMKLYREAMGTQIQKPTDIIDEITKIKTVAEMFQGGTDTNQNDIILELVKSLSPAVIAATKQKNMSALRQVQGQKPAKNNIDDEENEETDVIMFQKVELMSLLSVLLGAAKRNSDPNLYVDLISDTYDDDSIIMLLGRDDWFQTICQYAPTIIAHENWFEEMRERLLLDIKDRQDQAAKEQQAAAAIR